MTARAHHIVIPGILPPAPRPRARIIPTRPKPLAQIYTPKGGDYGTWKKHAAALMATELENPRSPIYPDSPLSVWLFVVLPLPTSEHRKTRVTPRRWCQSQHRGDADNLAKGPLDAGTGILWDDDRQVVSLHVEKVIGEQGEEPRVEMIVMPLEERDSERTWTEELRDELRREKRLDGAEQENGSWQQVASLPLGH